MHTAIWIMLAFCFLIGLIIWLARREGKKSAKLEALKAEVKRNAEEQRRTNEIFDNVRNMDEHTCRQRLHEISNKQR